MNYEEMRDIILNSINQPTDERSNPNSESFDPLAVIKEKL